MEDRGLLSRAWWALPHSMHRTLDRMATYFWYAWQLLRFAWKPTCRVVRDTRTEAALLIVLLGLAIFVRPSGETFNLATATQNVAWGFAAVVTFIAIVFLWNLALAPPRMYFAIVEKFQSEVFELEREMSRINHALKTQQLDIESRVRATARQIGTELRDIRHKIDIIRSTRPNPHYPHAFRFPGARWNEYDRFLAEYAPELYGPVEKAYTASHHVNEALRMRETRAGGRDKTLGVIADDGLDAAYEAAGEALDALGEQRGEVWETEYDRAVRLVTEDMMREAPSAEDASE